QAFEHFALFGSVTTSSSCSNFNGATLTVPYGFYRGGDIFGMSAASDNRGGSVSEFNVNFAQFGSGWFFEPNGLLIGEATVFDPQVVNTGIPSAPFNVECKSVKRYRYLGANSASLTFQAKGVEKNCPFTVLNTRDKTACIASVGLANSCFASQNEFWS